MKGYSKVYKGPFTKKQANGLARDLKKRDVGTVSVRPRSILKNQYDVYIKIDYDEIKRAVGEFQAGIGNTEQSETRENDGAK